MQETPHKYGLFFYFIFIRAIHFWKLRYKLKIGKNGEWNKELLIDRREKSKSLAWSSIVLAFEKSRKFTGTVNKPKELGDIRGISYIYPILWRFGLIEVPEKVEETMKRKKDEKDSL